MIRRIEVDLTNWSRAYPTGVVAYDQDDKVIDSAYSDELPEFREFFTEYCAYIGEDTDLQFLIDANDIGNDVLLELAKAIATVWENLKRREI